MCAVQISNVKVQNSTGHAINVFNVANIVTLTDITYGVIGATHFDVHSFGNSRVYITGTHTIDTDNTQYGFVGALREASIECSGSINITGNISVNAGFINASDGSYVLWYPSSTTITGSVIGSRYNCVYSSHIRTNGSSSNIETYIPGSIIGISDVDSRVTYPGNDVTPWPISKGGTGATQLLGSSGLLSVLAQNKSISSPTSFLGFTSEFADSGAITLPATRDALGLGNTTGALPIANGGTGSTAVAGTSGIMANIFGLQDTPTETELYFPYWTQNYTRVKNVNTTNLRAHLNVVSFLTQAQYDALSTAVKNNGTTYFIYA